jgi:hypothetical protein
VLGKHPNPFYITFVPERHTMYDELWTEIQDMPGEIFDIPEMRDDDDNNELTWNAFLNSTWDF